MFNWDGLAQRIMNETPLNEDEKSNTRVCIIDNDGNILADTQKQNFIRKNKLS